MKTLNAALAGAKDKSKSSVRDKVLKTLLARDQKRLVTLVIKAVDLLKKCNEEVKVIVPDVLVLNRSGDPELEGYSPEQYSSVRNLYDLIFILETAIEAATGDNPDYDLLEAIQEIK